jgi:hypothetical protein
MAVTERLDTTLSHAPVANDAFISCASLPGDSRSSSIRQISDPVTGWQRTFRPPAHQSFCEKHRKCEIAHTSRRTVLVDKG